ncbi:unnamed protein product [Leptosia nina]|uniref:Uncharacterized protein n=1 Tax=Leptosia nina TaxID=320188 RepID=A0AAV1IY47_9NEOP
MWATKNHHEAVIQLDENLQQKRRELLDMLESFERQQCLVCLHLKCTCSGQQQKSELAATGFVDEEIRQWMNSSKIKEMLEVQKKIQQVKQNLANSTSCSAAVVDVFFQSFKMSPNTSVASLTHSLCTAYDRVKKKPEYSYF